MLNSDSSSIIGVGQSIKLEISVHWIEINWFFTMFEGRVREYFVFIVHLVAEQNPHLLLDKWSFQTHKQVNTKCGNGIDIWFEWWETTYIG